MPRWVIEDAQSQLRKRSDISGDVNIPEDFAAERADKLGSGGGDVDPDLLRAEHRVFFVTVFVLVGWAALLLIGMPLIGAVIESQP